ncbi:MAG: hypothetical protein NUW01_10375, partial [Gemmatimonadaceae bacterium]|nr:hypothetical protein [Gemmatimonadaceae bacterium]
MLEGLERGRSAGISYFGTDDPIEGIKGVGSALTKGERFTGEDVDLVKQLPEGSRARKIAGRVAEEAFDPLNLTVAIGGAPIARGLSKLGPIGRAVGSFVEPITTGGLGKRIAAETGVGLLARTGGEMAVEALPEDAPGAVKAGVGIGAGILSVGAGIKATRSAARGARAGREAVESAALRREIDRPLIETDLSGGMRATQVAAPSGLAQRAQAVLARRAAGRQTVGRVPSGGSFFTPEELVAEAKALGLDDVPTVSALKGNRGAAIDLEVRIVDARGVRDAEGNVLDLPRARGFGPGPATPEGVAAEASRLITTPGAREGMRAGEREAERRLRLLAGVAEDADDATIARMVRESVLKEADVPNADALYAAQRDVYDKFDTERLTPSKKDEALRMLAKRQTQARGGEAQVVTPSGLRPRTPYESARALITKHETGYGVLTDAAKGREVTAREIDAEAARRAGANNYAAQSERERVTAQMRPVVEREVEQIREALRIVEQGPEGVATQRAPEPEQPRAAAEPGIETPGERYQTLPGRSRRKAALAAYEAGELSYNRETSLWQLGPRTARTANEVLDAAKRDGWRSPDERTAKATRDRAIADENAARIRETVARIEGEQAAPTARAADMEAARQEFAAREGAPERALALDPRADAEELADALRSPEVRSYMLTGEGDAPDIPRIGDTEYVISAIETARRDPANAGIVDELDALNRLYRQQGGPTAGPPTSAMSERNRPRAEAVQRAEGAQMLDEATALGMQVNDARRQALLNGDTRAVEAMRRSLAAFRVDRRVAESAAARRAARTAEPPPSAAPQPQAAPAPSQTRSAAPADDAELIAAAREAGVLSRALDERIAGGGRLRASERRSLQQRIAEQPTPERGLVPVDEPPAQAASEAIIEPEAGMAAAADEGFARGLAGEVPPRQTEPGAAPLRALSPGDDAPLALPPGTPPGGGPPTVTSRPPAGPPPPDPPPPPGAGVPPPPPPGGTPPDPRFDMPAPGDRGIAEFLAREDESLLTPGPVAEMALSKPIIRQGAIFLNPSLDLDRALHVAYNAEGDVQAALRTKWKPREAALVDEIRAAWDEQAPRYVGPDDWIGAGRMADAFWHPDFYADVSPRLRAAIRAAGDDGLDVMREMRADWGSDVMPFRGEHPDFEYLPTVNVHEDYLDQLDRTADSLSSGSRTKERVWERPYDRWKRAQETGRPFEPELDLATLLDHHRESMARL